MNTNIVCARNWYRVWNLSGSYELPTDGEPKQVSYHKVIITDDEKNKPYEILCQTAKEAAQKQAQIAQCLDLLPFPLWVALQIDRSALPPELLAYELKRCKHQGIPVS